MGGVPVKHHSKSKVGRRRSHLALKKVNLAVCANCQAPVLSHRVCANCNTYQSGKSSEK
jgi:large subunit ribosomal protein L32